MPHPATIAFIGSAGIPNTYGGFEAFLEQCAPELARRGYSVVVTCDAARYPQREPTCNGVRCTYIAIPANGAMSVFHDLAAFLRVYPSATHVVVLGVSGGVWFPLMRLLATIRGQVLCVNVDGVEWQRGKFAKWRKAVLRLFDGLAQIFAHRVVIDNDALKPYLLHSAAAKAEMIPYSGDHVVRVPELPRAARSALTICRIEPENNIEMLIEGALASSLSNYTVIGNWESSAYGKSIRERFRQELRLRLLDPTYDRDDLAAHREQCSVYLHGHSVGGTNPSLVEMLFYDSEILCLDVAYHRHTAGNCARYFRNAQELARRLDEPHAVDLDLRNAFRQRYRVRTIADDYCMALGLRPLPT